MSSGCTGFPEEAQRKFLEAGCDAVWTKPIPPKKEAMEQIVQIRHKRMKIEDKLIPESSQILSSEANPLDDESSVDEDDDESSVASLDDNLDCLLEVESINDKSLHE